MCILMALSVGVCGVLAGQNVSPLSFEVASVKAVSDLFAPLTGKVVKVNSPLSDSPEYVNEDPYDEGWMIQVAVSNPKELDGLMDAAAYQTFVREQGE